MPQVGLKLTRIRDHNRWEYSVAKITYRPGSINFTTSEMDILDETPLILRNKRQSAYCVWCEKYTSGVVWLHQRCLELVDVFVALAVAIKTIKAL